MLPCRVPFPLFLTAKGHFVFLFLDAMRQCVPFWWLVIICLLHVALSMQLIMRHACSAVLSTVSGEGAAVDVDTPRPAYVYFNPLQ
jgi:hypothetical protein